MRPFDGVRMLDLTHVFAGPFSTFQLAALGADVIKVEPPHAPDMTREAGPLETLNTEFYGANFQSQNAGKRAITLDLRHQAGKEIMRRLIESADVLVQNYAGDALAKLGFGYTACAEIKPDLIYCSLTGFGRTGPKANHPAYDIVIQAYSGLMAANGAPGLPALRVGPAVVDYGAGAQAALAISAALFQRTRTGRGQQIDVAMADAAMMLMCASVVDTVATSAAPPPHGNQHPDLPAYGAFETADGLLTIGAYTTKQIANLFEALGDATRAAEIRKLSRAQIKQARDADEARIGKILRSRPAATWEALLNERHVPAARVRRIEEALEEHQIRRRDGVQPSPGADLDPQILSPLPTAAFSYAHGAPKLDRPAPRFGEHTDEALGELGYGAEEIRKFRDAGVV